mgnify:FL=1
MRTLLTLLKVAEGLGVYLVIAIVVWMVLAGELSWANGSFGAVGEQPNARDLWLYFTCFPAVALCWPLILLLIGGIDAGGRRLGIITE